MFHHYVYFFHGFMRYELLQPAGEKTQVRAD